MTTLMSTLKIGDTAPAFTLPARPGEPVDVGALFGKKPVVLLFLPLAFSPVCTNEVCHVRDDFSAISGLSPDVAVFAVTIDSPFVTAKFQEEHNLPFPVLSDFNKTVATEWGALHEDLMGLKGVTKRAAFVVGADGKISYAWVSDDPKVMPNFDEIKKALV